MLLVILIHYLQITTSRTPQAFASSPAETMMNLELYSISIICVHCFILISGYFGIRWNRKSFSGLIFQIAFWALIGFIAAKYLVEPFMPSDKSYTIVSFLKQMFAWYQGRWFISAYLFLYLLSPLINSFMEKSTDMQLLKYIIVFYVFSTVYGWIMHSREFNTGLSAISLVGLYMLGAWLRRSKLPIIHWSKWYDMAGFLTCTLILTGVSALLLKIGIGSSIYGYLNPIVIVESMFLFQFFRKWDFGHVGWVNFLAGSAFAAFLMHCHPYLGDVFCNRAFHYIHRYDYSIIYAFALIAFIFLISVLVDKIRLCLWKGILKIQPS